MTLLDKMAVNAEFRNGSQFCRGRGMRHTTGMHDVVCGCRSAGECACNDFAWKKAIDACVDEFAEAMKQKLYAKRREGKSGWDDPAWSRADILRQLSEHVGRGDMVDVANFAMFAWNQGDGT